MINLYNVLFDSDYYKKWLKHSGLRPATKKSYSSYLRRFQDYLIQIGFEGPLNFDSFYYNPSDDSYESIDVELIDGFVDYLIERKTTKTNLYRTIVSLKSFLCFLENHGYIANNPMRNYPNPFFERRLSNKAFSLKESTSLMKAANLLDPFSKHYLLLFSVLLICGLRASEIINLTKENINLDNNSINVVLGQKTSASSVHYPDSLKKLFLDFFSSPKWLEWEKEGNSTIFFWEGQILNRASLKKVINIIAKKAKFTREINPHQFRHTMATLMYNAGIELAIIKRQLRHSKLETTLIYVLPNIKTKKLVNEYAAKNDFDFQ